MTSHSTPFILGTWGLGGAVPMQYGPVSYGDVTEDAAFAVLDAAWAAGIRRVDTAASYGDGEAYRRLTAWQECTGKRFQVIVKPGRPMIAGRPVSQMDPEDLITEIEQARSLFGVPAVILLKDPPSELLTGQRIMGLVDALAARYPAAQVGFVSHNLAGCADLPTTRQPRIVLIEYHGLNWWVAAPLACRLRRAGWTVWAMQPLAYGFLGGSCLTGRHALHSTDWRLGLPRETWDLMSKLARSFVSRFSADFPGISTAALAIGFCLTDPHVEQVVIGPKSVPQLQDALTACVVAGEPRFRKMTEHIRRHAFGGAATWG